MKMISRIDKRSLYFQKRRHLKALTRNPLNIRVNHSIPEQIWNCSSFNKNRCNIRKWVSLLPPYGRRAFHRYNGEKPSIKTIMFTLFNTIKNVHELLVVHPSKTVRICRDAHAKQTFKCIKRTQTKWKEEPMGSNTFVSNIMQIMHYVLLVSLIVNLLLYIGNWWYMIWSSLSTQDEHCFIQIMVSLLSTNMWHRAPTFAQWFVASGRAEHDDDDDDDDDDDHKCSKQCFPLWLTLVFW